MSTVTIYKYVAERSIFKGLDSRGDVFRPRTPSVSHPATVNVGHLNRGTV